MRLTRVTIATVGSFAAACTGVPKDSGREEEAPAKAKARAVGTLKLALPAWASVSVDGTRYRRDEAVEVSPGAHAVAVDTPCGSFEQRVEVAAASTEIVGTSNIEGLQRATLALEVRDRNGKPIDATVKLGEDFEANVPTGADTMEVPACSFRLTVRPAKKDGLGGFIEDVDLAPRKTHKKRVELLPGADLVRIHGGHFWSGPPPGTLREYRQEWEGYENVEHRVATFDIDRHEVTVANFQACVAGGACAFDPVMSGATRRVRADALDECNIRLHVDTEKKEISYRAKEGHAQHPVDCLAMWKAEAYCEWAGKRLPTNVEWEFAARSRNTQYKWPWGNDGSKCRAHTKTIRPWKPQICPERKGTAPVCSYPEGNSEQGVCDLEGNVKEMLEFPVGHPRRGEMGWRGGSYHGSSPPFDVVAELSTEGEPRWRFREQIATGFRCARDVKGGSR